MDAPRFVQRRGLGCRRGWDVRLGDEDDEAEIRELLEKEGVVAGEGLWGPAGEEVSWHVIESVADERMLGCVGTRLSGGVGTVVALAAGGDAELTQALAACSENAASCNGASACRTLGPWAEALGYARADDGYWVKQLGSALPEKPQVERWANQAPLPEAARPELAVSDLGTQFEMVPSAPDADKPDDVDDLAVQFEMVSSIQAATSDLVSSLDSLDGSQASAPAAAAGPGDDDSLEDLVGSLLKVLKTDQGKKEFDDLARRQRAEAAEKEALRYAALAPRAFVPRPVKADDDPTPDKQTTTSTLGDARAFAELLASDAKLQYAIRNKENRAARQLADAGVGAAESAAQQQTA